MSPNTYDITQCLLDRANIQDLIARMYLYLDQRKFEALVSDIFAEEMHVDYTAVKGGEPEIISGRVQSARWEAQTRTMATTHHLMANILPELPQPGQSSPPTCVKVHIKASVVLRKDAEKGDSIIWNGGTSTVEAVRVEGRFGNPWRVSGLKANPMWMSGTPEVMLKT